MQKGVEGGGRRVTYFLTYSYEEIRGGAAKAKEKKGNQSKTYGATKKTGQSRGKRLT